MANTYESSEFDIFSESSCSLLSPSLKYLESTFADENKTFVDKVDVLVTVWQHVIEFILAQTSTDICEEIFKFIYPHTINIILHSGWLTVEEHIKTTFTVIFDKCLECFTKFNSVSVININSLVKLVHNPWDNPLLKSVINDYNTLSNTEVIEYFKSENLLLISTRIKVLIQSKSEDLALQLVNAAVKFTGISPSSWIEVYIRVITYNINDIEYWRLKNEDDKLRTCEIKLSRIMLLLAEILQEHIGLSREIILTAFSLNPTNECFAIIKRFHYLSHNNNNNTTKTGVVDLKALPPVTGKVMVKARNYDHLKAESHILEACEELNLSTSITSDLISIICNQRYKKLSWMNNWSKLKYYCEKYIRKGVAMRNLNKELKYLDINYRSFNRN